LAPGSIGYLAARKSNKNIVTGCIADLVSKGCITLSSNNQNGFILKKVGNTSTSDGLIQDTRNQLRSLFKGNVQTITFSKQNSKSFNKATRNFRRYLRGEYSAQRPPLAKALLGIGQLLGASIFTLILGFIVSEDSSISEQDWALFLGFCSYLSLSYATTITSQFLQDKQLMLTNLGNHELKILAIGLVSVPILIFLSPQSHFLLTGLIMLSLTVIFHLLSCKPVSRTSRYAQEIDDLVEMIKGREKDLLNPTSTEITSKAFEKLLPAAIALGLE
jgi:hypothetical protein